MQRKYKNIIDLNYKTSTSGKHLNGNKIGGYRIINSFGAYGNRQMVMKL